MGSLLGQSFIILNIYLDASCGCRKLLMRVSLKNKNYLLNYLESMQFFDFFFFFSGKKCTPSVQIIYDDTNRQVEKISRVLYVVCVEVLPQCSVWPKFVASFVEYLTADSAEATHNNSSSIDIDLGSEVFQLPTPMWYAQNFRQRLASSQWLSLYYSLICIPLFFEIKGFRSIVSVQGDIW